MSECRGPENENSTAHLTSTISRTIKRFDEPEVRTQPILTDGTHLRSLHWTGHYIPDPTLALANGMHSPPELQIVFQTFNDGLISNQLVDAWTLGRFQSLGFAKSWSGRARLPSQEQMWREYPGAGKELSFQSVQGERAYSSFLNSYFAVHIFYHRAPQL